MSTKHVSLVSRSPQMAVPARTEGESARTTQAQSATTPTELQSPTMAEAAPLSAPRTEHQFEQGAAPSLLGGSGHALPTTSAVSAPTTTSPELASSLRGQLNAAHVMGTGRGGGAMGVRSGGMVRSGTGPVDVARWQRSPEQVLGHLTQRSHGGSGAAEANAPDRCGAANLLGVSVMAGPASTRQMLMQAAENPGTTLTDGERGRLREIAGHIDPAHPDRSSITFEELNEAQGLLYRAGNTRADALGEINDIRQTVERARRQTPPDVATIRRYDEAIGSGALSQASWRRLQQWDGHSELPAGDQQLLGRLMQAHRGPGEYRLTSAPDPQDPSRQEWFFQHARGAGTTDHSRFDDGELAQLASRTMGRAGVQETEQPRDLGDLMGSGPTGLQAGQAATLRVQADERTSTSSDHYITVGRSPNGQYYLYNPDPGPGDATLITGSRAQVMRAAQGYDERILRDGDRDLPNLILTRPH